MAQLCQESGGVSGASLQGGGDPQTGTGVGGEPAPIPLLPQLPGTLPGRDPGLGSLVGTQQGREREPGCLQTRPFPGANTGTRV